MPDSTGCQVFGCLSMLSINYSFPGHSDNTFCKYKSCQCRVGKTCSFCLALHLAFVRTWNGFLPDLETWAILKYIQAHTIVGLMGLLMKVFARFWNFPTKGAGCWLTLIVIMGAWDAQKPAASLFVTSLASSGALEFSNDFTRLIHLPASFIPFPSVCQG